MSEITLCLLKPHLVKNPIAVKYIRSLLHAENVKIIGEKHVTLTPDLAGRFYEEHKGKFFYDRLVSFSCSGPIIAKILGGDDIITRWRDMLGPTRVYKTIYSHPGSIRGLFGLTDTRNAAHGSDSPESAAREIAIIFPDFFKENT